MTKVQRMRIGLKLALPIAVFAGMFFIFGAYIVLELETVNHIEHRLEEARQTSQLALDFNVENYHTQLEVWEYAYEPSQKRLDAFETHKRVLDELLIKLNGLVDEQTVAQSEEDDEAHFALYAGARNDLDEITDSLLEIEKEWVLLFDAIEEHDKAKKEGGISGEELKRLDSMAYQKVIQNEDLFDRLEFNKRIDEFVSLQETHTDNLRMEHERIISSLTSSVYGLIPIVLSIIIIMGRFVSTNIIRPIKELNSAANLISKGISNVRISPNPSKDDEFSQLVESFNIMSESIQKNIDLEKELAVSRENLKKEKLETVGLMSSSLSHNLRNPLTAIKGASDFLKHTLKDRLDEPSMRRFSIIDESVLNMLDQIEGVLAFVRNKPLNIESHSILKILESTTEKLVIPSGVRVILPKNDVEINCDSQKLEVVFSNIISNAIQSVGEKGHVKARIKTASGGLHVNVEIEDSGSGIPEENLTKIFEPLFTTKRFGTGLGLAACKGIVEQHGGTVSARNEPATTFVIALPTDLTLEKAIGKSKNLV